MRRCEVPFIRERFVIGASARGVLRVRWAEALILTDLVELEHATKPDRLAAARHLVTKGPFPDLADRLRSASKR